MNSTWLKGRLSNIILILVLISIFHDHNSKASGFAVKPPSAKRDVKTTTKATTPATTASSNHHHYKKTIEEEPTPILETVTNEEEENDDVQEHQHDIEDLEDHNEVQRGKQENKKPKSGLLKKCDPCPDSILCVPQIQCPAHVRMSDHEKPQVCDLPGGKFGFCCQTGQNHTAGNNDIARMPSLDFISPNIIEEARRKFEYFMHNFQPIPVQRGQPEFFHSIVFHSSPQEDVQNFALTNSALEQVLTTQEFAKKENIPVDDLVTNNIKADFRGTPLETHCGQSVICGDPRPRYRSFDGTCNNPLPHRAHWGSAGQPMERVLPPAYEDGVWTPRIHSKNGGLLAGARDISSKLLIDVNRPHPRNNILMMQFGQFLAHDVSQTASVRTENSELVQCCASDGSAPLPKNQQHFACMPILVSENDEFFSHFNVRCMNFVRLSLAPNTQCQVGYGKQRSKVTHFLDASTVYGSSRSTMLELRTFRGGQMRMFNDFGRELLPLTNDKKACESEELSKSCFKSGDGRTNQIISLVGVHLLFAREHNRVAAALAVLNPRMSDEQLFQEARRIVIAELQHIVYNEYLPEVVGPLQMKRFRLTPLHHGYSNQYSSDLNPAITNEFSGAAFRMGHSTVDGKFHLRKDNNEDEMIDIPDVMFNPSRMRQRTFFDRMLNGMMEQPMQKADTSITQGLSHFLFRNHNPFGLDLAAINIQRGRDQGLRSYNDYLELMGHRRVQSFSQLSPEVSKILSKLYSHPDDIDLWVGGLMEKPVDGGIVGITFAELIADQFSRFKRGDRYFYEYSAQVNPGAFTLDQLNEIRKASMARIVCDNADHIALMKVPPAAFVRADLKGNAPVRCDDSKIPTVDLEAWRMH